MVPIAPRFQTLLLALVGATALIVAGCSGSEEIRSATSTEFPGHSAQQIHQQITLSPDTLAAFSAQARLSVDAPQRNGQFNATIRQRRNDSLYMSISPGLGVEAARLLVTPDSFFVYDRINKQLAFGALHEAQANLPVLLTTQDIFVNMLGLLAPDPSVSWQVEADDEFYYLHDPSYQRTFKVDPSVWRVVQYEERQDDGTVIEERTFADFETVEGVMIPRRITLRRPQDEATASLLYRSVDLNPGSLSFDLEVGSDVSRIPVLGQSGPQP